MVVWSVVHKVLIPVLDLGGWSAEAGCAHMHVCAHTQVIHHTIFSISGFYTCVFCAYPSVGGDTLIPLIYFSSLQLVAAPYPTDWLLFYRPLY